MKFTLTTEGGTVMEIESGMEVDLDIDDKSYTIIVKENGGITRES